MPFENKRRVIFVLLVDILISSSLLFLSLRIFLLSNGYFAYQDQAWVPFIPVTIGQHPGGLFTPFVGVNGLDLFALFHDFYTFPYYLISFLTSNYLLLQKLFIMYSFLTFTLLLFVGGHLFAKLFFKHSGNQPNLLKGQLIAIVFVLISYSNFSLMSLNVDGGTFSESVIFAIFLIAILTLYGDHNTSIKVLILGTIFSLSLFLDASYVPLFILFLLIASIVSFVRTHDARKILVVLISIIISLPIVYYTAIALHLASSQFVPIVRPFDYNYVLSRATNLNIFMVLLQLGRAWPIMAFGPPTILGYEQQISQVPVIGNLPQLLVPYGIITTLWLLDAISIVFLGLLSVFFKKNREFTIPVATATIIFIILTQAMYIKQFVQIIQIFVAFPVVGPEIGEVFSLPSHLVLLVTFGTVLLYSHLFSSILCPRSNSAISEKMKPMKHPRFSVILKSLKNSKRVSIAIVVLLVFIVIFAYWQSFDGSYYPDGPFREGQPGGNQIPNSGAFSPYEFSKAQLNVINEFLSKDKNASFGFYWPMIQSGGPEGFVSSSTISYIISHDMLGSLSSFLRFQGVKYIVAWNLNDTFPFNEEGGLKAYYGTDSFTQLLSDLNETPNLQLVSSNAGYFIYNVLNFSSTYISNLQIYENAFSYSQIPTFSVLTSAGIYPVYLAASIAVRTSISQSIDEWEILSPYEIMKSVDSNKLEYASWSQYGEVIVAPFNITTASSLNIVEYSGNGSINGFDLSSRTISAFTTNQSYVNVSGKIEITSIVEIFNSNALQKKAIVADYPYVSNTILRTSNGSYSETPTLQGSMAFFNASGKVLAFTSYSIIFINFGYVLALTYSLSLGLGAAYLIYLNRKKVLDNR